MLSQAANWPPDSFITASSLSSSGRLTLCGDQLAVEDALKPPVGCSGSEGHGRHASRRTARTGQERHFSNSHIDGDLFIFVLEYARGRHRVFFHASIEMNNV